MRYSFVVFFPVIFFVVCAIIATIVELYHQRNLKQGKKSSLAGRCSSLNLQVNSLQVNSIDSKQDDEFELDFEVPSPELAISIAKGTFSPETDADGSNDNSLGVTVESMNGQDDATSLLLDQIQGCVQEFLKQKGN